MAAMRKTGRSLRWWLKSQLRTELPCAGAAKIALIARQCHRIARGGAAGFTESRRSNRANRRKSNPDIRCAPVLRLTCGRSVHSFYHATDGANAIETAQAVLEYFTVLVYVGSSNGMV